MENKEYKVSRNDIYIGEVVSTDRIYRYKGDTTLLNTKPGQLYTGGYFSYRSMLFVPNEDKLSNDLLYQSPNYPILNITDDEICLGLGEKSIVIKDAYNLAALLEYFGYNKVLTFEDIIRIRKTFFTGRFGMDNSELFGMEEFIPTSFKPYKDGIEIQDKEEIYALYKKSLCLGSERHFSSIPNNVLPRELMNILDARGRSNYGDTLGDIFEPNKQEGPIRKLARF